MVIQRLEEFFNTSKRYTMWVPLPKNPIYIPSGRGHYKSYCICKFLRDINFAVFAVKVSSTKLSSSKFHWQNYLIVEQDTREMDSRLHCDDGKFSPSVLRWSQLHWDSPCFSIHSGCGHYCNIHICSNFNISNSNFSIQRRLK